jgi:GT2 family glycosyltransferase
MSDPHDHVDRLEAEVERLHREVERQRRLGRASAQDAIRAAERNRVAQEKLTATRAQLKALQERRSVQLALDMSRQVRRVRRRLTRQAAAPDEGPARRTRHRPASQEQERQFAAAAAERLLDLPPPPTTGPLVSIVMLNRDGEALLRRNLPALAATAYRDLELVVIDNASTDGSLDVLSEFRPRFDVRVIRNDDNATFSEANNQGTAAARGELVVFLNNDIEPLEPGWLGWLVDSAADPDVVAVGARLIYPRRTSPPLAGAQHADLTLQHAGVAFRMVDGAPLPVVLGGGEDALSDLAVGVRDVPALTAACLLVRRAAVEAVGGFSPGYVYGQEDVDLCLKLRDRGGRLVYDGRAALWHHESSSRNLEDRTARMARTVANRDRFIGQWAPRLYRTVLADALHGGGFWHAEPFRLATSGVPARFDGAAERGWVVTDHEAARNGRDTIPDAVLVAEPGVAGHDLPMAAIRIAWIADRLDAWLAGPTLDDYDIVVAPDADAATTIEARTRKRAVVVAAEPDAERLADVIGGWLAARRFGIRIAVPTWDVAEGWGDLHFARDAQRALERAGHPTRLLVRADWDAWWAAHDDVGLHLLGRAIAQRRHGRLEVLWHISHPDAASIETYEAHDLAFVASDSFARWMDAQVGVPVRTLHQATDPRRFDPSMEGPHHELLFVANSRGVRRHLLVDLLPTSRDLAVYGRAWTPARLDPRYLAGEHIPNRELGGYYASADIVLNDHWSDMQREGFLSNRLYDASAAGAFVISDGIEGLEAEFDGGVVAYDDPAELRALIDRFLADPDARREHAARARAAVLERHTFERRIAELLTAVEPALAARPASFERAVPQLAER